MMVNKGNISDKMSIKSGNQLSPQNCFDHLIDKKDNPCSQIAFLIFTGQLMKSKQPMQSNKINLTRMITYADKLL